VSCAADTYVLLRAFVDELARSGMRAACTSPGSRSAPLALSLAREPCVRCYSHVDERCAGFFALGLAKASGLPVAVTCTSGTAVAELLPAVIEAHEARVPLLVLSADRPPELRENGAGQAIDQLKLFGGAAKWFFEIGTHEATNARLRWIRTLACRAYATALECRPGVVHLNFALREPLVTGEPLADDPTGRRRGAPYVRRVPIAAPQPAPSDVRALREIVAGSRRGMIVAGRDERVAPGDGPSLGATVATYAAELGWPLLGDPMSGGRRGAAAIAHYDALLRDEAFATSVAPDLVLRIGDLPVSKSLRGWLGGLTDVRQLALDPEGAWQDPDSALSDSLALDPAAALRGLATQPLVAADPQWLARWRSGDELAAESILATLDAHGLSEPTVAIELGVLLPAEATLFVASSMPVREIETFWPVREDPPRVLCNRGANGIDGIVSSAFGAAAAGNGPVVLLIGDVALAHDIGGLLASKRLGLKLTIVLLDNGGGGIFDFLAVAGAPIARDTEPDAGDDKPRAGEAGAGDDKPRELAAQDIYTRHIATPTGLDFADAARLYGLAHERVEEVAALRTALERAMADERSAIVEVRGDRDANVRLHREVWRAVSAALAPALG
jgi:2-succinyl-5-enolpyruvyl-6-hydroxy-3-cyclohexene-1-carboxylate synthase